MWPMMWPTLPVPVILGKSLCCFSHVFAFVVGVVVCCDCLIKSLLKHNKKLRIYKYFKVFEIM